MSTLRRLSRLVRGRRLVAAGLLLVCTYLFANNLDPTPRFVVRTSAKLDQSEFQFRGPSYWGTVEQISNDGRQVIVGIHRGDFRLYDTRLELWDTRTGANLTPEHWQAPDWQRLLTDGANWTPTGLTKSLTEPSGLEFVHDEAAWSALRERLAVARANHVDDIRKTVRPVREQENRGSPFPDSIRFSPDGKLIAFVCRNGWPVHLVSESMGDGTAVEDARSGRRIAMLPGVTHNIALAPGGRTAVTRIFPKEREGEQPWLILWDLETATRRAELLLPDGYPHFRYSPNGEYVFATTTSPHLLRWWDTTTGRQIGEIASPGDQAFVSGGRVMVIQVFNDHVLHFWDVATGRELSEWDPSPPRSTSGRIGGMSGPNSDRYLALEYDPEFARATGAPKFIERFVDWVSGFLPNERSTRERRQFLVVDLIERREVGLVPGVSAALSPNGRWLATVDPDGVVRVWEVPISRPWGRGAVYAAGLVFGGWFVLALLGMVRRRLWRRPASVAA